MRHRRFAGDESFGGVDNKATSILDAGVALGVVIEGQKRGESESKPRNSPGAAHL